MRKNSNREKVAMGAMPSYDKNQKKFKTGCGNTISYQATVFVKILLFNTIQNPLTKEGRCIVALPEPHPDRPVYF